MAKVIIKQKKEFPVARKMFYSKGVINMPTVELNAYNPNQPRDPKGSKTGGQWTKGDSESAANPKTYGDFKKTVRDFIEKENENGLRYRYYGIRIEDLDRKVGDRPGMSMHNPDREDIREFPQYGTKEYKKLEKLGGSSSWRIDMDGYDEKYTQSIMSSYDKDNDPFLIGGHVYIIAGDVDSTHWDADPNEIVIGDPIVVYKIQ